MSHIWKFTLVVPFAHSIDMPIGARLLHVHEQDNQVCVWAEVDPSAPTAPRSIFAIPTGMPFNPDDGKYLGTVHLGVNGHDLVFHVYDGGEQ